MTTVGIFFSIARFDEHLDGATADLVADLAPVEQEPVPHVDAWLREGPLIEREEADLDWLLSQRRRQSQERNRADQDERPCQHAATCHRHARLP